VEQRSVHGVGHTRRLLVLVPSNSASVINMEVFYFPFLIRRLVRTAPRGVLYLCLISVLMVVNSIRT
jgi:hypothetical protein